MQRAGHDELASPQRLTQAGQRPGQPGGCLQRAAERRRASAGRDHLAVAGEHHAGQPQRRGVHRADHRAEHDRAAAGQVGDCVRELDPPAGDPAVHDLDRRGRTRGGAGHVQRRAARPGQVSGQDESDLGLDPRVDEVAGATCAPSRCTCEARTGAKSGESTPNMRCIGRAGQAELVTGDAVAVGQQAGQQVLLDPVGVVHRHRRMSVGERLDRYAGTARGIERGGHFGDGRIGQAGHVRSFPGPKPKACPRAGSYRRARLVRSHTPPRQEVSLRVI